VAATRFGENNFPTALLSWSSPGLTRTTETFAARARPISW